MNPETASVDRLCRLYIIHSFVYYEFDRNFISDQEYDKICNLLLAKFDEIEYYWINLGIDKESLIAGTGHKLKFKQMPQRIQMVVQILIDGYDFCGNKIKYDEWLK